MDTLYLPLRSNAAWFSDADAQALLEARIKAALVTHENLLFQDGRYMLTVWENGHLDVELPPGNIPGNRGEITYHQVGQDASFSILDPHTRAPLPLLQGPVVESFEVDFYPILSASGLLRRSYVRYEFLSVPPAAKSEIKQRASVDTQNGQLIDGIAGNPFQRSQVVSSAHYDSAVANALSMPFVADWRVEPFLRAKSGEVAGQLKEDLRPAILQFAMEVLLPDFTALNWDEVDSLRESGPGRDLRRHLEAAAKAIGAAAADAADVRDLERIIQRHYLRELAAEVSALAPTKGKSVANLAANVLPVAGAIVSTAADLVQLFEFRNSWVSLVRRQ